MTKVKICGLVRTQDIQYVNETQPDYCGFIINFPRSHRSLSLEQVQRLRENLSDKITPVGVFVNEKPEVIAEAQNKHMITIAQLHGGEDEAYIAYLRKLTNNKPIWKAFKIRSLEDIKTALISSADCILLDNGYGTGATFDWSLITSINRPWILAGGLTVENLSEAIQTLRPWGVDISSGVETNKIKDREKILKVVSAVRTIECAI